MKTIYDLIKELPDKFVHEQGMVCKNLVKRYFRDGDFQYKCLVLGEPVCQLHAADDGFVDMLDCEKFEEE